jgi:hemerythrin-like domain-containing protein
MNPIEELIAEHEAVRVTLKILNRIILEIEKTSEANNPKHLEQLLEFFSVFVDRCHHGKEEDLLFPALEEIGVSRQGGPIGVMLNEHQQGREHVIAMKKALTQYSDGGVEAAKTLVKHARSYIELLSQHIDKENGVLFPLASQHLPPAKLIELQKGFDQIETERVGAGRHEAFHRMIKSLEDAYLQTN